MTYNKIVHLWIKVLIEDIYRFLYTIVVTCSQHFALKLQWNSQHFNLFQDISRRLMKKLWEWYTSSTNVCFHNIFMTFSRRLAPVVFRDSFTTVLRLLFSWQFHNIFSRPFKNSLVGNFHNIFMAFSRYIFTTRFHQVWWKCRENNIVQMYVFTTFSRLFHDVWRQ